MRVTSYGERTQCFDLGKGSDDIVLLIVHWDDDVQFQARSVLQKSQPQPTGMISSRTSESGALASKASKPAASRRLALASGRHKRMGVSQTNRKGWPCRILFQISSASSRTVVPTGVERLKSSLMASGRSMQATNAPSQIPTVRYSGATGCPGPGCAGDPVTQDLLHEIGHDMAHRKPHVSAQHLTVTQCPSLSNAHTVEGADDGMGQLVLFPGPRA